MIDKIKKIVQKTDHFLYKKFGSDKSTKPLENIKEAQIIFSHLNELGLDVKVRFVGGCVRKAICGERIDDVDLATSHEPPEVKKKLSEKGIKVIDTGLSHGTITAIIDNKKFEITTLRKDILTDGRHATVEYTTNWELDAQRRDFTINAIYVDKEGRIFDPLKGIEDLKNGKIKFVGSAEERIQEDYLRILRYFRFFTQYSKINHEENVVRSIKKYINGLNKISNERIFNELTKILSLNNIYNLFSNKASKEIFQNIFPQFLYYERLKIIKSLNKKLYKDCDVSLVLALLIIDESNNYEYFCHKYKVSNTLKKKLQYISKNFEVLKNKNFYSKENIKKLIYISGKNYVKDLLFFSLCLNYKKKNLNIEELINYVKICKIPKLPVSGELLKEYGYETGLKLGKTLKSIEEYWIENNFVMNKKDIVNFLNKNKT
jgi:tRNA nucleotidyltransferase/poly(A) polymerase